MKNRKIMHKILSLILVMALIVCSLPVSMLSVNAQEDLYDNWTEVADSAVLGTDYNKTTSSIQIHTAKGLAWFAAQVNTGNDFSDKTVTLENNIDLTEAKVVGYSSTGTITAENSWQAIGNENNKFSGTFDGNGKTISAVYINSDKQQYQGLFGYVENDYGEVGTIKNLGVVNSNIESTYDSEGATGGIVGRISGRGLIEKCYFNGEVNGTKNVGSIIGIVDKVSATSLGENTVTQCYNTGVVRGTENTGGIIGNINSLAFVSNCYNTGLVTKPLNYSGAIYKHAGIVGRASNNSIIINNCYNIGEIQGNEDNESGIACIDENAYAIEVTNCYYNTETSGIVKKTDNGLTTAQMTGIANGTDKYNDNKMDFVPYIWTFTENTFNSTTNEITYNYPVLAYNEEVQSVTKKESKITLPDTLVKVYGTKMATIEDCTITGRDTNTENNVYFTYYSDEKLTKKVEDISKIDIGTYYVVAHLEATTEYSEATSNTAKLELEYAQADKNSYTIATKDEKKLIINENNWLVYEEDTTKLWINSPIIVTAQEGFYLQQESPLDSDLESSLTWSSCIKNGGTSFYTKDKDSGAISEHYFSYNLDANPPKITIETDNDDTTWTNKDVEITIQAHDNYAGSGDGLHSYSLDGGVTWIYIPTNGEKYQQNYTFTHILEENQTLNIWVKDHVGHITKETFECSNIDQVAPTGSITIDTNTWDKLLESVTFGIYKSSNLEVSISSNDNLSGIKSVEYLTVESAKTLEKLQAESSWSEYNAFTISAVDNSKVIVYAKITDNAGNVTYLSSNGIVFDTIAPVISGVSNNGFYSQSLNIEVTDANIETITLNGKDVEPKFEIAQGTEQTYTLVATDKVGNVTSCVFNTYVKNIPVKDVLDNLPTIDDNTSDEEKEHIKDTINNLTDKYIEELKENTDKDEDTIVDELKNLEEALIEVNTNISIVGTDKVVSEDIADDKKAPTVEITPQGLLVAIQGSNTHKNNINSNMELSLSITQLSGDENSLVFDIKPMVSVNGNNATIIPNSDLNAPVAFKLYLNNSFKGSIAMVKHIKENGSTATYNNVPVKQDSFGKYLDITANEFSKFIVSEYSYTVSVDETSSIHKATDKVTLTTPTKEGYNFTGWESDDVEIVDGSFIVPDKNVTIISTWKEVGDIGTQTGDNSNVMMWIIFIFASFAGVITLVISKKARTNKD